MPATEVPMAGDFIDFGVIFGEEEGFGHLMVVVNIKQVVTVLETDFALRLLPECRLVDIARYCAN